MPQKIKEIFKNLPVKAQELFNEVVLTDSEQEDVLKAAAKSKSFVSDDPLTEDEKQEALMNARRIIFGKIKQVEYAKKVFAKPEDFNPITPQEWYDKLIATPGYVADDFNTDIIWNLCLYFSGDNKCRYDLNKGLYLYGPAGCGKTSLMQFFQHNQKGSYAVFPVREVSEAYARSGVDGVNKFKSIIKTENLELNFGQTDLGICFDDLGTEVDKKHYGNESNVMADIILARYDRKYILKGKTHITSNLSADELQERYGYRVRSRFREMFNMVEFDEKCPDRRK